MQQLSKAVNDAMMKQEQDSKSYVSKDSVNALQFIGETITAEDLVMAEELLKASFNDVPKEKFNILWQLIKEEGWTNYRLKETVKYIIKTHKYPNWSIADFFSYKVELFTYSKYLEELHKMGRKLNDEIEWYEVDGRYYWKYKDGKELPLKKAEFKKKQ